MRKSLLFPFVTLSCLAAYSLTGKADDSNTTGSVNLIFTHLGTQPAATQIKGIGNEVIYQIFVDRFSDGNPQNNCLFEGHFCSPDFHDWYGYWGGDIRGIINKIDYLHDLGPTRLWLTPIFENQQVIVRRNHGSGPYDVKSYHGYGSAIGFASIPFLRIRERKIIRLSAN